MQVSEFELFIFLSTSYWSYIHEIEIIIRVHFFNAELILLKLIELLLTRAKMCICEKIQM